MIGPEREEEIRRFLESRPHTSPFERMEDPRCPACEKGTLQRVSGLQADWVQGGERIVLANLSGFRCDACGKPIYDGASSRLISRFMDPERPDGAYTASVSSLGGGRLGIYLPRDVLRNVDLNRNDAIRITPLSRRRLLLEKA